MRDTEDQKQSEESPGRGTVDPGNTPQGYSSLPWLWVVLSCLLSGMVAELGRYNTLWGSGSRFFEFAFPLWLNFGSMHIPGLVLGFVALMALRSGSRSRLILLRYLFLGAVIAGAVADFDEQRFDLGGSPPWMFMMVDGFTLFLFSFLYVKPEPDDKACPVRFLLGALLLPGLLVGGVRFASVLSDDRHAYSIWTSDWNEGRDLEVFWLERRDHAAITLEECALLASVAADPYRLTGASHQQWPARHRVLHLFSQRDQMWLKNPTQADLKFEWWPDGRGQCFALGRDYEYVKGVRGDDLANYPWPEGRVK